MVVEIISADDRRLLPFLEQQEHLLLHTPSYAHFIEAAFLCRYLFAIAGDELGIKTILPFVAVKSALFGNRIISTAYLEYGGFVGEAQNVGPILDGLKKEYGNSSEYLEIRGGNEEDFDAVLSSLSVKKELYKRFVLKLRDFPLPPGDTLSRPNPKKITTSIFETVTFSSGSVPAVEFFRSHIQESKRKAINKSRKNNVEVKSLLFSDSSTLDEFYDLYCRNMKRFGSPPYSRDYFVLFQEHLVSKRFGKIYGAYVNGKLAAALVGLCYRDRVHVIIAVSDEETREFRPNDAVHSEFIEWAIENDFKYFDFGRVREESGQFEYKQKWGPVLLNLPSYFVLWNAREIPVIDPHQAKYRLFVGLWKKMPLSLTKKLGHRLRKGLGI